MIGSDDAFDSDSASLSSGSGSSGSASSSESEDSDPDQETQRKANEAAKAYGYLPSRAASRKAQQKIKDTAGGKSNVIEDTSATKRKSKPKGGKKAPVITVIAKV